MADFFRGVQNYFDPSGKPERDLDDMLDAYAKGGKGHKDAVKGMRDVMALSPDLKERVLEAVRDGYITKFSAENPGDNAAAGYNAHSRTMHIRPQFNGSDQAYIEMMFAMGHETDHARSLKGENNATKLLHPTIVHISEQPGSGPRNYTGVIELYVNAQRQEEAQANIGGFNAIASYAMTYGKAPKGKELETMYELDPVRMGDFINKSGGHPVSYDLKPGLTVDKNFHMPKSHGNIEAMKVYYADKMIDGDYMMYRQEAIKTGMQLVQRVEEIHAESNLVNRKYIIDPGHLQAHPSLNLPLDGVHEVRREVKIEKLDLNIDLSGLGPLVSDKSQSSSVSLVPTQDDHPLFAQALTKMAELDKSEKLGGSPQEIRNAAAALAFASQECGMTKIDSVMLNSDKSGFIASQGSGLSGQNIGIEGKAMSVDADINLAKLKPMQEVMSSQSLSQQESLVQGGSGTSQKF